MGVLRGQSQDDLRQVRLYRPNVPETDDDVRERPPKIKFGGESFKMR
jgi:hypothetical protein